MESVIDIAISTIKENKNQVFDILRRELNVTLETPNIKIFGSFTRGLRGNIDPQTLALCLFITDQGLLDGKESLAKLGIEKELHEFVIGEFAYDTGRYAANLINDFAFSDHWEPAGMMFLSALANQNLTLMKELFEEYAVTQGRYEGIARFTQAKVLEEYNIDAHFEETIFPEYNLKKLKDVLKGIEVIGDLKKSAELYPLVLNCSAELVGDLYRDMLRKMDKPEIRKFVYMRPNEVAQGKIKEVLEYLYRIVGYQFF